MIFRGYISAELFHFLGRGKSAEEQYQLLKNVLNTGWLMHPPFNLKDTGNLWVSNKKPISTNEMYNPQIICFSDIPTSQLQIHSSKYSAFGVGFLKKFLAERGARPVTYVPSNGRVPVLQDFLTAIKGSGPKAAYATAEETGAYFDRNARELSTFVLSTEETGVTPLRKFVEWHILSYLKFFDISLPDAHGDNYYFEREWRMTTHLNFQIEDLFRVVLPRAYKVRFRQDFPAFKGKITTI